MLDQNEQAEVVDADREKDGEAENVTLAPDASEPEIVENEVAGAEVSIDPEDGLGALVRAVEEAEAGQAQEEPDVEPALDSSDSVETPVIESEARQSPDVVEVVGKHERCRPDRRCHAAHGGTDAGA